MNKNRVKAVSLLVTLTMLLSGSSMAAYGTEVLPGAGNDTVVSQNAGATENSGTTESKSPAAPTGTAASEVQGTSDVTVTLEVQSTSEVTATPEVQSTSEVTSTSEVQGTSEVNATFEVQGTSEVTATSEVQGTSEVTATSEVQSTSEVTATSEVQGTSEVTATSEVQSTSEVTATPENQAALEKTEEPSATESSTQESSKAESSAEQEAEEAIYEGVVQLLSEAQSADPEKLSLTATKGVYWFEPSIGYSTDLTDTFIYDDALLKGNSLAYNKSLATMSYALAVSSISSLREPTTPEGYANKSRNLQAFLEDNGFSDFAVNKDYTEKMTSTSMGVACAHKKIVDNGKTYTVLVIAPRSAGYELEWGSNFMMGKEGDHEGFNIGKDHILDFVKQYVGDYGISGDIKVWTAGYSRGAAVTDLAAAALLRDPKGMLGDSVTLTPENFYCYTFGTPGNADVKGDYKDDKYLYVHNTYALYDIVTALPPTAAGFDRYGTYTPMVPKDEKAKEEMLALLKAANPALWENYVNGGGDPDGFQVKTIDLKALFEGKLELKNDEPSLDVSLEGEVGLQNDTSSYLPDNQEQFLQQIVSGSLMDAVGTRENYYANYQDPLVNFGSYLLTHTAEAGNLMAGITESPYGIPAGAAMYMYVLAEKLLNNEIPLPESNEKAQQVFDLLQNAFNLVEDLKGIEGFLNYSELKNLFTKYQGAPADLIKTIKADPDARDLIRGLTSNLYSFALRDGLKAVGADEAVVKQLTSDKDSLAMSRILAYLLFEDGEQVKNDTSLAAMNANMIKHCATFISNAGSYLVPHLNEVIISWLKVQDAYYAGIEKETPAQIAGYRRVYIQQPEGVDVTGYVKDSSGKIVAVFKNGELISRTDSWISITTSDKGNWLRLPSDQQYNIDFEISDDTTLTIVVSEYDTYENKEVRIETSDSKLSWKDLLLRTKDRATLVLSSLMPGADGSYSMGSTVPYFIDLLRRFTITYMLDGGILDQQTGSITMDVDDGASIVLPAPTRDGYTFAYWQGSTYYAGDLYTVTGDHTFTAIWNKIADKVDPSGNTGDKDAASSNSVPAGIQGDIPYVQPVAADSDSALQKKDAPMTGDSSQMGSYCAVLFLSGTSLVLLLWMRRRERVRK